MSIQTVADCTTNHISKVFQNASQWIIIMHCHMILIDIINKAIHWCIIQINTIDFYTLNHESSWFLCDKEINLCIYLFPTVWERICYKIAFTCHLYKHVSIICGFYIWPFRVSKEFIEYIPDSTRSICKFWLPNIGCIIHICTCHIKHSYDQCNYWKICQESNNSHRLPPTIPFIKIVSWIDIHIQVSIPAGHR